jgi:hypothetical protein
MFFFNPEILLGNSPEYSKGYKLSELFEIIQCLPVKPSESDELTSDVYLFGYEFVNDFNKLPIRHYHSSSQLLLNKVKIVTPNPDRFLKLNDFIFFNKGFNLVGGLVNECLSNHYHGEIPLAYGLGKGQQSRLYGAANMVVFRQLESMSEILHPAFAQLLLELLANYSSDGFKSLIQYKTINYIRLADFKDLRVVLPLPSIQQKIVEEAGQLFNQQLKVINSLKDINYAIAVGVEEWNKAISVKKLLK